MSIIKNIERIALAGVLVLTLASCDGCERIYQYEKRANEEYARSNNNSYDPMESYREFRWISTGDANNYFSPFAP